MVEMLAKFNTEASISCIYFSPVVAFKFKHTINFEVVVKIWTK